jgi:hypothetical protein
MSTEENAVNKAKKPNSYQVPTVFETVLVKKPSAGKKGIIMKSKCIIFINNAEEYSTSNTLSLKSFCNTYVYKIYTKEVIEISPKRELKDI